MNDFFTSSVLVATFASAIRLATPYLLASLGETIGQRSGVLNLGVDGVMLLSAFFSYWTVLQTGNLWLAVVVALAVGVIMGVFLLCWVPFFITNIVSGFCKVKPDLNSIDRDKPVNSELLLLLLVRNKDPS